MKDRDWSDHEVIGTFAAAPGWWATIEGDTEQAEPVIGWLVIQNTLDPPHRPITLAITADGDGTAWCDYATTELVYDPNRPTQ